MNKIPDNTDAASLRRLAEERLKARASTPQSAIRNPQSEQRALHELQVHQIELEMQNEELLQTRARADALLVQYTDLYDFAPTGYLTLDRDGAIRQVNLTGALLLGVERSRLANRRFGQFVAEGDRRVFSDFLEKVFASEAKTSCEVTLPREGSQPLVVRIEGIRTGDGQECRAAMSDITERKRAEEALRLFERAVTTSTDAIGMSTADGKHYYQNKAFDNLFGEIGKNPQATLYVDEAVGREVFDTIQSGAEWTGEVRMRGRSGKTLDIMLRAYAIKDGRGTVTGLVGVHTDFTERKQMEDALEESEEKHRAIVEQSADGIVITDEYGAVNIWNSSMEAITGIQRCNTIGKPIWEVQSWLIPDELITPGLLEQLEIGTKGILESKTAWPGESREQIIKCADGTRKVLQDSSFTIKINEHVRLGAIMRDITERKKAEEALAKRNTELERFNRVTVDREVRMIGLKKEINALLKAAGQSEKYKIINEHD